MTKRNALLAAAVVLLAVALFSAWRRSAGPIVNLRPSSAVGEVLAGEAARLLSGQGKVVVIGRASAREGRTASGEQMASFITVMGRQASPKIAATEWLPPPPTGAMDTGGVTAEQLVEFSEKHPEASAFVVFAGLPPFSPALAETLSTRSLKLMAVCGYSVNLRRWLESRAVAVAVVPRLSDPPPAAAAPRTAQDWFQREFELLTPESLQTLPY